MIVFKLVRGIWSLRRNSNNGSIRETRLKRLAGRIDDLADKDERILDHAREMAATRSASATELYAICRGFVDSINQFTTRGDVLLDPPEFPDGAFHYDAPNLLQINVRGRLLQIEFACSDDLVSTEEFRVPYTLAGAVRAFNQALLDKDLIEEQLLFFTVERHRKMWRFFDPRTYRTGPFDGEYLVSLLERLL